MTKHELPSSHYRAVQLLVHHGREAEANELVRSLNMFQRAFGFPDYEMPPPISNLPDTGLVAVRAKGSRL